jgi:hypothetical protein
MFQRIAWVLWIVGTALIVGSWIDLVPALVGWGGFFLALIGTVLSYVVPVDRSQYPLTQEGFPVEPSGVPLPPDAALTAGMPLLAYSRRQWWRATVIAPEGDGALVCFPGWDARRRERIPRKHLQLDPDPTRTPISFPDDGLRRWRQEPPGPGDEFRQGH